MNFLQMWVTLATTALLVSTAFGADRTRGTALFNDPKLVGAAAGKSCNSCHPDGRGLDKASEKKNFNVMGKKVSRLEDAVNVCIKGRMKGKALAPESQDLADLGAYIRSLTEKTPELPQQKRSVATGC